MSIDPKKIRQELFGKNALTGEFFDFICGELIGFGISRAVFESNTHEGCVVKVEYSPEYFQNIYEFQAWHRVERTDLAKWFAPCVDISECGKILIQKKTTELTKFPEKVPAFFTDIAERNWGQFKGRPVCHDYGCHLLIEHGMTSRLRKADWTGFGL